MVFQQTSIEQTALFKKKTVPGTQDSWHVQHAVQVSYTAATYFPGHNWPVSTATSVKPVTLTSIPISSLSDDSKYILSSEVLMGQTYGGSMCQGQFQYIIAYLRTCVLISFCVM
jgi:hypothetical protein